MIKQFFLEKWRKVDVKSLLMRSIILVLLNIRGKKRIEILQNIPKISFEKRSFFIEKNFMMKNLPYIFKKRKKEVFIGNLSIKLYIKHFIFLYNL